MFRQQRCQCGCQGKGDAGDGGVRCITVPRSADPAAAGEQADIKCEGHLIKLSGEVEPSLGISSHRHCKYHHCFGVHERALVLVQSEGIKGWVLDCGVAVGFEVWSPSCGPAEIIFIFVLNLELQGGGFGFGVAVV